jgi:protein N-lysine methyltransferase METTL21A
MFALMQKNIELNNLHSAVAASIYDWGETPPANVPTHPDIVLAADCVYFEPAFPLLQKTLQDLIGENTVCYFCFKKRRRADMHFVKVMKKTFDVKVVEDDPDRATYSRENLFLQVLSRPCGFVCFG